LKLLCRKLLSTSFNFNLRRYIEGVVSLLELGGHMDLVPMDVEKLMVGRCRLTAG
jgi:hypothetical protein